MSAESDESSEGDLEVLAGKSHFASSSTAPSGGPCLSATGTGQKDPILLMDDSSSSESESSLRGRLMNKKKKQGCKKPTQELASTSDISPEHSSKHATTKAAPTSLPAARAASSYRKTESALASMEDSSSDSEADNVAALLERKIAPRSTVTQHPKRPRDFLSSSSEEDDDDDDSKPTTGSGSSSGCGSHARSLLREHMSKKKLNAQAPKRRATTTAASKDAAAALKKIQAQENRLKKEQERREKEEEKQRKLEERQRAEEYRQREKAKKEMTRVVKKAAQEAAKSNKKRVVAQARQNQGKHAKEEIAVLMEPGLFRHELFTLVDELRDLEYSVTEYSSALGCKAIQWIRKDYLNGGATDAVKQLFLCNKDGFVHLHSLTIVFDDPVQFINLLERNDDDDNFPMLEEWLKGVQAGWRSAWGYPSTTRPRMILMLHRVNQELSTLMADFRAKRNGVTRMPPSSEELQDAIAWLLIQFQVECVACSEVKYLYLEIAKITRMLSEEPYQQVATDFDCIPKLKRSCDDDAPLYEQATDCWMRQLQQLNGVSFEKARSLVRHYPTARSLWLAYQNEHMTEDEKRLLVSELFGTTSRQMKLSDQLYRLFTSNNPDEVL